MSFIHPFNHKGDFGFVVYGNLSKFIGAKAYQRFLEKSWKDRGSEKKVMKLRGCLSILKGCRPNRILCFDKLIMNGKFK